MKWLSTVDSCCAFWLFRLGDCWDDEAIVQEVEEDEEEDEVDEEEDEDEELGDSDAELTKLVIFELTAGFVTPVDELLEVAVADCLCWAIVWSFVNCEWLE